MKLSLNKNIAALLALVTIPAGVAGAVATASDVTGHSATARHTVAAAALTDSQLKPTGVYGEQSQIQLTPERLANARQIVDVVHDRKLPPYAAVVSLATAMQETHLDNLTVAVDHDSLGLFQQRPSSGWGLPHQLINPQYATNAFLDALQKTMPNYQHTSLWEAAQATQQSAFPTRYAQWQDQAAQIVKQVMGAKS